MLCYNIVRDEIYMREIEIIQVAAPETRMDQELRVEIIPSEFHEPEETWPEVSYTGRHRLGDGGWQVARAPGAE